jgi:hypothetical protein
MTDKRDANVELACDKQLAIFEAFRRLGFLADDIYFGFNPEAKAPFTVLRSQGLEFVVMYPDVRPLDVDAEKFFDRWKERCEEWNGRMPESQRRAIFNRHIIDAGMSLSLVHALHKKGFVFSQDLSDLN